MFQKHVKVCKNFCKQLLQVFSIRLLLQPITLVSCTERDVRDHNVHQAGSGCGIAVCCHNHCYIIAVPPAYTIK